MKRTKNILIAFLFVFAFALTGLSASATIAQRGIATTASSTSGTTLTINKPSGVVAGDVMIVNIVRHASNSSTISLTGWTSINQASFGGSGVNTRNGAVLYRVADGTEGANFAFSLTSASDAVGAIVAFSGVSSTAPFDATPGSIARGGGSAVTATGLTTVTANAAVIMLGMDYTASWSSWSTTSPGSLGTKSYDTQSSSGGAHVGAAWALKTSAGATGNGTATLSKSENWGGIVLALRPANPTTTVGTATATVASQTSINVTMPYTYDDNTNNTYTVEYKFSSGSTWTTWAANAAHTASPYTTTITGLTPGASYDVRVTYNDTDGVTGSNPQTMSGVTTTANAITAFSAWSNLYHGSASPGPLTYTVLAGSGSRRVLVVALASSQTAAGARTVTLTYGGQTLTSVNGDMGTATVRQHTALYYLNEAGLEAATTTTLSVTVSGGTTRVTDVFAAVYDNVDQTTPITNSKTYSSGTAAVSSFGLGTGLAVNAENQAIEIISSVHSGSTTVRTVSAYAANWSNAGVDERWTTTDGVRDLVTTRMVPSSNVAADTTSTTMSGTSLESMTALSLGIAKATPAVIWSATGITYGQALSASSLSGSQSSVAGTYAFTSPSTIPAAGTYNAAVTFTPTDTVNYNAVSGNVNVTVAQKALDITANNDSKTYGASKTYGTGQTAFTVGVGQLMTANGDAVTSVTLSSSGAAASATYTSPGPTYSIVPTTAVGSGLGNYNIAYHNGTLALSQAALDVTANNDGKTYGTVKTFATTAFSQVGLVAANGDTLTGVTETSTGGAASAVVSPPTYPVVITPGSEAGKGLGNYTISYVNGALTVNAASSATAAASASATHSASAQNVTLHATITSGAGTVNCGRVMFTVLSGSTPVGTATGGSVSSGSASVSYGLPADQSAGVYTIQATYHDDGGNIADSTDSAHSLTISSGNPAPSITGIVNETNTFGMSTVTLTGTVSATTDSGTVYPASGEAITATISGYATVPGTFTNGTGGFLITYSDPALASAPVSTFPSPYTITYTYAGNANLDTATDGSTTLTVLPALAGTSSAGALDGYTAGTIPVVYVTKNASGITYSNVVLATTASDDHKQFTITIGVPPGTTSVRIKPRFYLSRVFHFDPPTTADDTTVTISGVTFMGGDADSNDQVDGTDYAWIRALWSSSAPLYDVNGDGKIDANDFPDLDGSGSVGPNDYEILKNGWYQTGDPE